jgi:Flp pilus assembly protein TadG
MRRRRLIASGRHGTATLELALVLPFLILLVLVGVDFARIYYHNLTLINSARTAAMYASSHPNNVSNTSQIKAVALADTKNLSPDPTVSTSTRTDSSGILYVTVTVSWDFYTVMNYPGVAHPITLSRSVEMRVGPLNPNGS